jgi:hypothetical protein
MRNLSLILSEEHRLRAFKKRVLRRIFGPEREEARGIWEEMRNEEPDIRMIRSRWRRCVQHEAHVKEQ